MEASNIVSHVGIRNEPIEKKYNHIWYWTKRLPERKGQKCRVLKRGRMNSVLVEFTDGYKVVASRFAVRRIYEC